MTILRWLVLLVSVIGFRVWFPGSSPELGITMDYDLVVIALVGLYRGQRFGAGVGWAIGFLSYAADPDHMAWGGLLGALLGWLIGHWRERLFLEQLVYRWLVFALGILGYRLIHYVLIANNAGSDFPRALIVSILPSALIDATSGVVIAAIWERGRTIRRSSVMDQRRHVDEGA